MARSRVNIAIGIALAVVIGGAPLAAQSTNTVAAGPAATPPASSTPAPAQSGNAVGPPQLRDFSLNGTVTQPAAPPAPVATTPPRSSAPASPPTAAPRVTRPSVTTDTAVPRRAPNIAVPDRQTLPDAVVADAPPGGTAPILPEPSFVQPPAADSGVAPETTPEPNNPWPWLGALIAITLGAALLWWRRRQRGVTRYAADNSDLGALVAARDTAPAALPPTLAPEPIAPRTRHPAAATPAPPPAQPAPVPPAPAPFAGGIVASGLKPRIEFELVPVGAETDAAGGAALTFDLLVFNRGSAPARDVLVEAQLINAGPQVDAEVGRFFVKPPSGAERVAMIGPMSRVGMRMRLAVPASAIAPLVIEGRKLLVPIIAINAFYRWSGGELNDSSSFLVGRGDSEAEKLAPFRLDLGARSWSGLSARLHSSGLQP